MLKILLRCPEDLHAVARVAAAAEGKSLTAWILAAIRAAILRAAKRLPDGPVAAALHQQEAV